MSLAIRSATLEDEAVVVSLWRACGLVVPHNDPSADFRFAKAGPSSDVLVGEDSGAIVAGVMVGHDGHRGWLYYVAVNPTSRRRGLGREIAGAAEGWLRDRGVVKVQLMVRETNAEVAKFYEHLGFEKTPRLVMGKWLSGSR
jgi:ribosomal protein S18 acetylase RimI-like enzyme